MKTIEYLIYNWFVIAPDKTALIDKKKSFSYKELFENIWASKLLLEKEYNISKCDTVILAANKNVSFVNGHRFLYHYVFFLSTFLWKYLITIS